MEAKIQHDRGDRAADSLVLLTLLAFLADTASGAQTTVDGRVEVRQSFQTDSENDLGYAVTRPTARASTGVPPCDSNSFSSYPAAPCCGSGASTPAKIGAMESRRRGFRAGLWRLDE